MIKYDVPFYADTTKDETHCVQAVFRMVLKYFLLKRNYTWQQLDRITRKQKNKGTWFMAGLMYLSKLGFDLIDIESFDYLKFYKEGGDYIKKFFPKEIANWYLKYSNPLQERKRIPEFLERVKVEKRNASLKEIELWLRRRYLVACDINASVLEGKKGFESHAILVMGYDKKNFFIHDPIGIPDRRVAKKLFKKACDKASAFGPNLTAFQYPNKQ